MRTDRDSQKDGHIVGQMRRRTQMHKERHTETQRLRRTKCGHDGIGTENDRYAEGHSHIRSQTHLRGTISMREIIPTSIIRTWKLSNTSAVDSDGVIIDARVVYGRSE